MREPVWLQTKNADKKTTLYVSELSEGAAARPAKGTVRQLLVHDNATGKKKS
jgi:hypothetical protein